MTDHQPKMSAAHRTVILAFAAGEKSLRGEAIKIHRSWAPIIGVRGTLEQDFMAEVDNPCPDLLLRGRYRDALLRAAITPLLTKDLEVFSCVTMAKRALAERKPIRDVLTILAVDGDKIREASPDLYRLLGARTT